ncbi:thioredoxin-like protein [Calocera viscosa TUFC12733]|uniref:Thioredoxin-like protein n=1 Tax=Calocera viscosa (strain TUFC12733) TaxID=1330018 RepID=A0A167H577_CALVF|nr:thioredoxin-like protein [Calocera viscosa TUFC12733]
MASVLQPLTSTTLWLDILDSSKLTVFYFYSENAPPCRLFGPIVEKTAGEFAGKFDFYSVDIDLAPDLAQVANVSAVPTTSVYDGPDRVDRLEGANPKGLQNMLAKHAK